MSIPTTRIGDHVTFEPRSPSPEAATIPEPSGDRLSRAIFAVLVLSASLAFLFWVVLFLYSSLNHPLGG